MTPSRAAQEKPTSPPCHCPEGPKPHWHADHNLTTAAARSVLNEYADADWDAWELADRLLAIEREATAATPSLDVERLAQAIHAARHDGTRFENCSAGGLDHTLATRSAAEYARLDEGSATPEAVGE